MNRFSYKICWAATLAAAAFAAPPLKGETMTHSLSSFAEVLHSSGPAPDRADKMRLYAFLVGRWDMELVAHGEDGATHRSRGEIHAGWVLEGRAIQDVWMTPPRGERDPANPLPQLPVTGAWYGTTLRVYDPKLDAWHI